MIFSRSRERFGDSRNKQTMARQVNARVCVSVYSSVSVCLCVCKCALVLWVLSGVGGLKWVLALMTIAGSAVRCSILLFFYSSPLLLPILLLLFRGHSEVRLDLLPIARATTTGAAARSVTPRPPILLPSHTLYLSLSISVSFSLHWATPPSQLQR